MLNGRRPLPPRAIRRFRAAVRQWQRRRRELRAKLR
jgi:hypothetical protein